MSIVIDTSRTLDAMQDITDIMSVISLVLGESEADGGMIRGERARGLRLISDAAIDGLRDIAVRVADLQGRENAFGDEVKRQSRDDYQRGYREGGRAVLSHVESLKDMPAAMAAKLAAIPLDVTEKGGAKGAGDASVYPRLDIPVTPGAGADELARSA